MRAVALWIWKVTPTVAPTRGVVHASARFPFLAGAPTGALATRLFVSTASETASYSSAISVLGTRLQTETPAGVTASIALRIIIACALGSVASAQLASASWSVSATAGSAPTSSGLVPAASEME